MISTNPARPLEKPRGLRCSAAAALRFGTAAAALLLAFAGGPGSRRAEAYRLYDNGALDSVVGSTEAIRWSEEAWGPGATLSWSVGNDPEWAAIFGSQEEFESVLEEAFAAWSAIPNADIRWQLSRSDSTPPGTWVRDSASRVFFGSAPDGSQGGVGVWFSRNASRHTWEIVECDVGAPSWWLESTAELADRRRWALWDFTDSFAACLGLGASASFPGSVHLRESEPPSGGLQERIDHFFSSPQYPSPVWPGTGHPSLDQRIGASLLRPGTGWLASVGSVAGSLRAGGEPVPYAHVWALRRGPAGAWNPVGAFTNRRGEFLIEGLEPGEYLLWAHPIRDRRLVAAGARTDLKDAVFAHPAPISAGQTTQGISIVMGRGRK